MVMLREMARRWMCVFEARVGDVAAIRAAPLAAVAVVRPLGDSGPSGSDVLGVDPTSGQLTTIAQRTDEPESFGAPAWWSDGSRLLFERQDRSTPGLSYTGASEVLYLSRIEMVQPNGTGRTVIIADGRQPASAAAMLVAIARHPGTRNLIAPSDAISWFAVLATAGTITGRSVAR
jgi:hypothetical protein